MPYSMRANVRSRGLSGRNRGDVFPVQYSDRLVSKLFFAGINQIGGGIFLTSEMSPVNEVFIAIGRKSFSALNLNWDHRWPAINNNVNFVPGFVTPEEEIGLQSAVVSGFNHLGDNKGFKERAPKWVGFQLRRIFDSKKRRSKPRIEKIKLGHFYQTFFEVVVMRLKQENNEACFQNADPRANGFVRDTAIVCQGGKIYQLACPSRAHFEESLENTEIANVFNLANISFQIGGNVIGVIIGRRQFFVVNPGIGALKKKILQRYVRPDLTDFFNRERKKPLDTHAPSQTLGYLVHQEKVLGAGENKLSRFIRFVHDFLQVGKKMRHTLGFVQNSPFRKRSEKRSGIGFRSFLNVGILKRNIRLFWKKRFSEGCFPRLAGPNQGNNGKCLQGAFEFLFKFSGNNHAPDPITEWINWESHSQSVHLILGVRSYCVGVK